MATAYLAPESSEVHAEVDFMTMFTTQNDDSAHVHMDTPSTQHASTMPVASVPAYDPLQVFDAAPIGTESWSVTPHSTLGLHAAPMAVDAGMAPVAVAYAPPVIYPSQYPHYTHPHLGQPFAAPTQFVEPSVALPNARPNTALSTVSAPETPVASAAPVERASSAEAANVSPSTSVSGGSPSASMAVNETAPRIIRRKRKLTPEDKRRICEIYRNSQGKIRQEDIAKEYSVDRSTISKILNQEDRWLDPTTPGSNSMLARRPGGRYPAIEDEMHMWLDEAVMHGREVRDSEAREEALKIGQRLGHPHFQASSKWWDGLKRRRAEEGRAMPSTRRSISGVISTPPMGLPALSRSYTAMSLDSPHQAFPGMPGSSYHVMDPFAYTGGMIPITPSARARSLSAPQQVPLGMIQQQPSSFGPAPRQRMSPSSRPSPVATLTRNRSYHGMSASPQRPALNRANSANGKPSPHLRLGASAFGLTPMNVEHASPEADAAPSLSPPHSGAASETSDVNPTTLSPSTPCTPAQPSFQVPTVPQPDLGGCQPGMPVYQQPVYYGMQGQYAYPAYEYVQQW